ncbi:MAG TPA: DUF5131 family protein [Candidatus Moranbacteria bacterium]|nr:DUF5131 family protein [Candidatus Moranbacteria bacterium]
MGLNKTKGNMYDFVSHTWNPIKGKCSHDCSYCYMKRWGKLPDLRLDEKEMKTDLGTGNFIFVGSSTDIFANDVPDEWIHDVLDYCNGWSNKYLFQTKNPRRYLDFISYFPEQTVLGTTIETNRNYDISKAPIPKERAYAMGDLFGYNFERMVTIEPLMDFDLDDMVTLIRIAMPHWVNIGADSQKSNLPEPPYYLVKKLIDALNEFTEVRQKKNLNRLARGH